MKNIIIHNFLSEVFRGFFVLFCCFFVVVFFLLFFFFVVVVKYSEYLNMCVFATHSDVS